MGFLFFVSFFYLLRALIFEVFSYVLLLTGFIANMEDSSAPGWDSKSAQFKTKLGELTAKGFLRSEAETALIIAVSVR